MLMIHWKQTSMTDLLHRENYQLERNYSLMRNNFIQGRQFFPTERLMSTSIRVGTIVFGSILRRTVWFTMTMGWKSIFHATCGTIVCGLILIGSFTHMTQMDIYQVLRNTQEMVIYG